MGRSDREERRKSKRSRRDDGEEDDEDRREHKKKRHHDDERARKERNHDDSKRKGKHEDRKERKHDKKKKKKKKKHSQDTYKKSRRKKDNLYPLGDPLGKAPDKLLDPGRDYFTFHKHLWVYLFRNGKIFNELNSDETHEAFRKFCKDYNKGKLEAAYYQGELPLAALEESKTTRHSWGMQISDREDKNLQALHEGVHRQTEYQEWRKPGTDSQPEAEHHRGRDDETGAASGPSSDPTSAKQPPLDRHQQHVANRRMREHIRTAEEEFSMTGGRSKDARERQIEKRKEVSAKIHGAARDHEAALELTDDAVYGGDDRGFRQQLALEKQRRAHREDKQCARVQELQNKEKDKQKAVLEMLGLADKIKNKEKIRIAPRNDG